MNQAQAAQAIAERWGVTRQECDAFAAQSHEKAHRATVEGRFAREIVPTRGLGADGGEIVVTADETIRPDTTLERLAELKPVLGTQWITAGISSPVTDGASAVVMMSGERAGRLGLEPLARVVASAVVGSDPELMLTGPIAATPRVLGKAGLAMDDIDVFEVNEAFAPIPLAWLRELHAPAGRLNPNGGAIALGHPVGNSGSRLAITAIHELARAGARRALVTLCTGGAMAPATIFERP
jgi:acetyl-CoA acyltransferase